MRSYRSYKGVKSKSAARKIGTVVLVLVIIGLLIFAGSLSAVLLGAKTEIVGEPEIMILLGCQVMPSGSPSILLRDRLDTALDYFEQNPELIIIVTGSKGGNEPRTEAECMAEYLISHGVNFEQVIQENQACNTWENLIYSTEIITENGYSEKDVVIVSNGFHLTRARMLWNRVGGTEGELSTIAAPSSHFPSSVYMHIREPLALLKSFILDRR